MCGICGVTFRNRSENVDEDMLRSMNDTMLHRGPDGSDLKVIESTGFAHRRLSIIDLSDAGAQPMLAADNRKMLTYNGEVYNYEPLRKQFLGRASFKSTNDSEVVLKMLETLGSDAIELFEGMFAFAYFDQENQELLLARDHFGIKPLYYSLTSDFLVFGSELKALRKSGLISNELDIGGLNDYFDFMFIPAPRTIFKNVKKLEPGHFLKLNLRTWESNVRQYWTPQYRPVDGRSNADWVEAADAVLQESVNAHMVADVEVGTFLSGGVDSTLVTSAAANYRSTIQAYTIDFKNEASSEGKFAKDVAGQIGLENHVLSEIAPASMSLIHRLSYYYDEPFSDSSMFPTYLVCKNAAANLKVCLSGDGGDELFSGYRHHELASCLNWTTKIPDILMSSLFGVFSQAFATKRRLYEWCRRMRLPASRRLLSLSRLPGNAFRVGLLNGAYRENSADREWVVQRYVDQLQGLPPVTQSQMFDMLFYLPGDMLAKVDRASMANSLEVRVPFLSKNVAEFALSIPEHQRYCRGQPKFVLRELMTKKFGRRHGERSKRGFSIPLVDWLREMDRKHLMLLTVDSDAVQHGILNREAIATTLNHVTNSSSYGFMERACATDLFSVVMFSAWWANNIATK